jgi:UDP-galactopyranose mutase
LPVVSTAIRDVVEPYGAAGLVEIADTAAEFVAAIEMLLSREPQAWLERVDEQLAQGSWDSTWAAMQAEIDAVLSVRLKAPEREVVNV